MTLEQAIGILHPDTLVSDARKAMWEVGCNPCNEPEMWRARDEATLLACDVMQREVERGKLKDCDWCEDNAFDLIYGNGFFGEIEEGKLCVYYYGTGEEIRSHPRKINFCPMCGKPLNNGKVDGDE